MLVVAEVAAIGAVAEPTAAALSQFEELGAALSQCAAGSSRRLSRLRLSGWLSRLRVSGLRCRCGGGRRGGGRRGGGGGLPQWLRLRRLRQLDLPGLLIEGILAPCLTLPRFAPCSSPNDRAMSA